jgi:hypothetical protein
MKSSPKTDRALADMTPERFLMIGSNTKECLPTDRYAETRMGSDAFASVFGKA